jgi:hypothetical protein
MHLETTYLSLSWKYVHQTFVNRKGTNTRSNVATISSHIQLSRSNRHLHERVINIDAGSGRFRNHGNFGCF